MACQGVAKRIPPRLLSQQQQSLLFFCGVADDHLAALSFHRKKGGK